MRARSLLLVAVVPLVLAVSSSAHAQPSAEAEVHFKRGVSLYQETDFKAALVEFRRAYELSHKWQLLYNVAQAEYQTREYAAALSSFETFLREGGERIPRARRAEIEQEIARLRMRVGKVTVRSNVPGAIVFIDDEPVGPTPLTRNVAVGSRRLVVKRDGYGTWTKNVEVASGDDLLLDAMLEGGPPAVATRPESTPPPAPRPPPPVTAASRFFWEPWAVTGVLAAATVTTGILALNAASRLDAEKNRFDVTDSELDDASSRAKTFAIVTDVLFVATLAAAGASVYFTFEPPSWVKASGASVRIAPTASGLVAVGRF